MQLPNVNASSAVYLDHTDTFEGAAEAWADAEIITAAQANTVADCRVLVSTAATKLRACLVADDEAARTATRLRARYRVRDVILDMRLMGLSDALLNGLCGRKYDHPSYRFVFKGGTAGDITEARIRDQPELVAAVHERLGKIEDFPGKQAASDLLADALQRSVATRADLDAAEKAENGAGSDELLARLEVRKALEQAYGSLITAFPGRRAFVESFFLKRDRPAAKAEPAPSNDPAPPAPPADPPKP